MKKLIISVLFALIIALNFSCNNSSSNSNSDENNDTLSSESSYLLLQEDGDSYKYVDNTGKTIIEADKYSMCYTDTFRTYAIVFDNENGFIAIDRDENILYNIFVFDNGPDYPSEGLFRIVKDKKVGFADVNTGKIVIQPKFAGAYPFENGKAEVTNQCDTVPDIEHITWQSDNWYFIDKTGEEIQ